MKLKLTLMAVAATLSLGYQAQATITPVGSTTNYDKVNISLSVTYQTIDDSNTTGSTYVWKSAVKHFGNKELLAYMASWTNTLSFPTGSFLAFDWDSFELVVMAPDKTNILFYAGDGINVSGLQAYIDYVPDDEGGFSVKETYVDPSTGKGSDNYVYNQTGYLHVYFYNGDDSKYVDLETYGLNTDKWNEHWTETSDVTTDDVWTDSEHFSGNGGWGYYNDNAASFSSVINMSGHSPLK